jgi:Protein of unknown function (DUF1360)
MDMLVVSLVVAALAVARMTRFLTEDFLTVGYRRWVVSRWGEDSKMAYLVHCPWCTSIWIALPVMPIAVMFPYLWIIGILSIPAASQLAGMVQKGKE